VSKDGAKRRYRRITPEKRRHIIELASRGATWQQIADTVDLSQGAIGIVLKPLGGVIRKELWDPGAKRLALEERIEIMLGLSQDLSLRAIARRLGRDPATVSRCRAQGEAPQADQARR
jgi:IS30 family transposase